MKNIDLLKFAYVFDGHKGYTFPGEAIKAINFFLVAENLYLSATREILTKVENLNDEFMHLKDRNPIHQIKTRVKAPKSIMDKLNKLGCELSVESARENITDRTC
jgi:putative GTP pyrophosphokinase